MIPGTVLVRAALALGLLVLGLATGLASLALHDKSWLWFALALVAPLLTVGVATPGLLRSGFALGWLAVLAFGLLGRPEGDAAVAGNFRGYSLLVAWLAVLTFSVATLPRPVRPSP